jgi:hypothetical protein
MGKKGILIVSVFFYIGCINAQISLDSIINMSIKNHKLEFDFQLKQYSPKILFYLQDDILNNRIETDKKLDITLQDIKYSVFKKWGRRKIGKGKVVLFINKIFFEDDKIVFIVIGGLIKKKNKPIQVFSENYVYVHYDINYKKWQYSFNK